MQMVKRNGSIFLRSQIEVEGSEHMLAGQGSHGRAYAVLSLQQAFGGEDAHRLAQNGAADAHGLGQFTFGGQFRARSQFAADDQLLEFGDDFVDQAIFAAHCAE